MLLLIQGNASFLEGAKLEVLGFDNLHPTGCRLFARNSELHPELPFLYKGAIQL